MQVYSVGIGNIDIAELQLISSDPDDEHVFILSSFRDAAGFVDFLSVTTCESESHGINLACKQDHALSINIETNNLKACI